METLFLYCSPKVTVLLQETLLIFLHTTQMRLKAYFGEIWAYLLKLDWLSKKCPAINVARVGPNGTVLLALKLLVEQTIRIQSNTPERSTVIETKTAKDSKNTIERNAPKESKNAKTPKK